MIVNYPNKDLYQLNDTVYSYIEFQFGDEFSYTGASTNGVDADAKVPGKGLNLGGSRFSGFVNPAANGGTASSLQAGTFQQCAIYNNHASAYAGGRY